MDKSGTIFQELPATKDGEHQEHVVNPEGMGLENHLFVAACETPEENVFWVIVRAHHNQPDYSGFAPGFKEAEKQVLTLLKGKRAICRHYLFALDEYVDQRIEQIMGEEKASEFSEASRLEFVCEKYGHVRYQIKRKTGSEVIVYAMPWTEKFRPGEAVPTFRLDKRSLDNKGEAIGRGKIYCTEARKIELDKFKKAPSYLQVFGLDWNATVGDVKYWFRKLSKEHHPDRGGSAQKFRELIESYEKAVKAIIAKDRRDGLI